MHPEDGITVRIATDDRLFAPIGATESNADPEPSVERFATLVREHLADSWPALDLDVDTRNVDHPDHAWETTAYLDGEDITEAVDGIIEHVWIRHSAEWIVEP